MRSMLYSRMNNRLSCLLWLVCLVGLSPACLAQASVILPVDSPAAHFSPGDWGGDAGRGGHLFRQSWTNGAYCSWRWSTTSATSSATLLISDPTPGAAISYFLDGHFTDNVPVPTTNSGIALQGLSGPGAHTLTVYLRDSPQQDRWNGSNTLKVTGLQLDANAVGIPVQQTRPWVLIIGDSITEGILAAGHGDSSSLNDYAFLLGQGLRRQGYDYGVSACGYSGWLRPGDATQDVPPYYSVTHGIYAPANSRWNKLDAHTSLLDTAGHLSAYGETGQEPAAILINYGTNEAINRSSLSDMQLSVTQCLAALRHAAPRTWLCLFVPFGLENAAIYPNGDAYVQALKAGVAAYQAQHRNDKNITVIDLGSPVANALASPPYGAAVHPNAAGHAYLAAQILPLALDHLPPVNGHSAHR